MTVEDDVECAVAEFQKSLVPEGAMTMEQADQMAERERVMYENRVQALGEVFRLSMREPGDWDAVDSVVFADWLVTGESTVALLVAKHTAEVYGSQRVSPDAARHAPDRWFRDGE